MNTNAKYHIGIDSNSGIEFNNANKFYMLFAKVCLIIVSSLMLQSMSYPVLKGDILQVVNISIKDSGFQESVVNWVVDSSDPKAKLSKQFATAIVLKTFSSAEKVDVDPFLLLALIKVESRFNHRAISPVGAKGLTQVMSVSHPEKVLNRNLFDPATSIDIGALVLKEYLNKYGQDQRKALLQYNGSLMFAKHNQVYDILVLNEYNKLKAKVESDIGLNLLANTEIAKKFAFRS
jgi:hypothetical protein